MPILRDALRAAVRLDWYEIERTVAELFAAEGRLDEAVSHYRTAVAATPDEPELAIHFGRFLLDVVRDSEAAIEQLRRAVSLKPTWVASRLELCRAYVYNRQPSRDRSILAPVWHRRDELTEFRNSIYARRVEVLVLGAQYFERIGRWRDSMVAAKATRDVVEESDGREVRSVRKDLAYLRVPVHTAAESGDPVAEEVATELEAWFSELALDDEERSAPLR